MPSSQVKYSSEVIMPLFADETDGLLYRMPPLPWLWPTQAARARAAKLQDIVRQTEIERAPEYGAIEARTAAVHARQDLVMTFSLQIDIHQQLVNISRGIWALVLFGLLATRHFW